MRERRSFAMAVMVAGLALAGTCAVGARPQTASPRGAAVKVATGSGVIALPKTHGPYFDIKAYGAVADGPALANQTAINAAIDAAAAAGGGTVIIPAGTFKTYSIRLKSNVDLHFAGKDSVLRAAVAGTGEHEDGGFYDAPEKNIFVGLQDGGHSHWANSLIYGIDVSNVTISGPGLIDGSYFDSSGVVVNVLSGGDPREGATRDASGVPGGANKAIVFKNAKNIIFRDFHIKNGGHFAILGTAVDHWTIDGVIVDTNRDAIDIDTSQNMTIRNSVFNSLTDDAIVMKGSFGIGRRLTSRNILIEHDTVSGYDAGSVLDKAYSSRKLIASDRDGPTGRVKFGTEGSCGLDTVTIRDVLFDRSRGFALESVDGAELKNILFTDIYMKHLSSSPIFIVIGDRGRTPVTGNGTSDEVSPVNNVRLTDTGWILPDIPGVYGSYPPVRYIPAYNKSTTVDIAGSAHPFSIVDPAKPTRLNPASIKPTDPLYANAVGSGFASVRNIVIRNVVAEDVDPRYPILLNGLVDHPIEDVSMSNVVVTYRGGLNMEHATEQRQINETYSYTPYQGAPTNQSIPWLVNTFFSRNEALLPRISWTAGTSGEGSWKSDPYNVPEMTREYPEPSMLGILPAYGLYARHVKGLHLSGVTLKYQVEDGRPAVVLDDVSQARFTALAVTTAPSMPAIVEVTNTRKREPDLEYVKDLPYKTTTVNDVVASPTLHVERITVDKPAPGTPPDLLYTYPTAPSAAHPYGYAIEEDKYPLPLTVYRPTFDPISAKKVSAGSVLKFKVVASTPAKAVHLIYSTAKLPVGATFDPTTQEFVWTPTQQQIGTHTISLIVNDGVFPVALPVTITVSGK